MQLAHRHRWPQGITAYSALPSKQTAHSVEARSVEAGLGGSGSGRSTNSSPSGAPSVPLDAAAVAMYGFVATLTRKPGPNRELNALGGTTALPALQFLATPKPGASTPLE